MKRWSARTSKCGNEKFDTSDETQLIRTPEEILQGQGTCLDLALAILRLVYVL
jgi:hypothetical protein